MPLPRTLITLNHLHAGYPGREVLRDVCLEVKEGDFLGITGRNGSGKTTLLRTMLGLLRPLSGEVRLHPGEGRKRLRLGYLPQQSRVDIHFPLSVHDVVMQGLTAEKRLLRAFTPQQLQRVRDAEEKMGVTPFLSQPLSALSGGQMQRTLLARALASDPEALFLDEPGTYGDTDYQKRLREVLQELSLRCAVVVVSHNEDLLLREARSLASVEGGVVTYYPRAQSCCGC